MFSVDRFIQKMFGTRSDRWIKKQQPLVARVAELEKGMKARSDDELRALTAVYKQRISNGATVDDLLPEAFATVREVAWRTMGMRHFDVQVLGGLVLHNGMVAEMKTGEGKTLTATMPVYLNALSGKGVHVVTVNDYLASRDADWMGRIYGFLGLTVGKVLQRDREAASKQAAYAADITYGTNNEFGFDYLRDNMKFRITDYVQRGHHYAIVDEVDSILIDEARTPLIISGPANSDIEQYVVIDGVVPLLQAEIDYTVDEKARSVTLTDKGIDKVEARLSVPNLFDPAYMEVLHHVNQALKAHTIFRRDRDYVVQDGKVTIVDENTGRLMPGRRWSDGLHQAIEAKEKVQVQAESQTYATITFQNYFRMYSKLAGMTGTAETEAEEFQKIYNLDVMVVPTNRPVLRNDMDDVVYKTQGEKYRAILDEIEKVHEKGQPILVGTVSVEKSEIVSRLLRQRGIPHEVLNARNHAREAEIVSQAGRLGAITISTNMAGRGTDIKLGGDPDALALADLRAQVGATAHEHTHPDLFAELHAKYAPDCDDQKARVKAAGGLHIIGTERHESRRIDNQLRGRSGRQGDPGSSRFYMALEDDLLRIFSGDKLVGWMERMGLQDDEAIEHRWINSSIEDAQRKVEGHNFNIRKNLLEYDDVMNLQRRNIYEMRRRALMGEKIREMIVGAIDALVDDYLSESAPSNIHPEQWKVDKLKVRLQTVFNVSWTEPDDLVRDWSWEELRGRMRADALAVYEAREAEVGADALRNVERMLLLEVTDQFWKDHLLAMDRLRDGIGLRGYGQKNPLLEFKREGTAMFRLMNSMRDEAVITRLLRMSPSQGADIDEDDAPDGGEEEGLARALGSRPASSAAAAPEWSAPQFNIQEVRSRLAQIYAARAAALASAPEGEGGEELDEVDDVTDGEGDGVDEGGSEDEAAAHDAAAGEAPEGELGGGEADLFVTEGPTQLISSAGLGVARPRQLGGGSAGEASSAPVDEAGPPPAAELEEAPPAGPPGPGAEARAWAERYGVKRNDPCPCGSGRKYKKCCGAAGDEEAVA
ncbi:MAG: preprotein translocase subunit SecA [Deltaproteobacteria bacterium]|jgi:preprotein translocase subunit SecA|nr:preprotein translocase subunit SecA [Deltaproteobacteria bacterium]